MKGMGKPATAAARWRELVGVAAALALAVGIRLGLAAHGWPYADSDEATMGLMADDILRHGAHPLFFYGQNYLGPFQAYLAVPFFAVFGPTNLALYATTTFEIALFLLILYGLTRFVFSPTVAFWTVLLLALGPYEALYFDLRAGAGLQETLLLGTLLLALAYLRLRSMFNATGSRRSARSARSAAYLRGALLDVTLGALAGLALWAHLLTVPFILAVVLILVAQRATQYVSGRRHPTTVGGRERSLASVRVAPAARRATLGGAPASLPFLSATPYDEDDTQPTAALGVDQLLTQPVVAVRPAPRLTAAQALGGLVGQACLFVVGFVTAAFPFLAFNLTHHGATFTQTFGIAGAAGSSPHPGLVGHAISLSQQLAATLLIGLPRLLNFTLLCPTCAEWPRPHTIVSHTQILHEVIIAAPLSLFVIALWAVNATDLLPARLRAQLRLRPTAGWLAWRAELVADPARWWGKALLTLGAALVFLEYVVSRASYATPDTSARYLVGLYAFTPLVVAPLVAWSRAVWGQQRHALSEARHVEDGQLAQFAHRGAFQDHQDQRRRLLGYASSAMLAIIVLVSLAGVGVTFVSAENAMRYGVPAGSRDVQVIDYLLAHHETRFYTTYWVCDRLMFEAAERITCAVTQDTNAFISSVNRVAADRGLVDSAPHPTYVFDGQDAHSPTLPAQLSKAIAAGDPRVAGYVGVTIADYHIFAYQYQAPT